MPIQTEPWDSAEYLDSAEKIAAYLDAVFEDGDAALIAHALGVVARSQGMTEIARSLGVSRESLYRGLSIEGNPSFATVIGLLKQLGLQVHVEKAA